MQNHTADSIKSLEAFDRAWWEEAHRGSQRSLDLLRPTIRKPGSELWFSWNPDQPSDPVDVLLGGKDMPPGAKVVEANYEHNPWFPEELRKEMEYDRKRDPDKYLHVWRGGYQTMSEKRVFKNWMVEEFERPAGTIHRLGADWGFAIDPAVLIRCDIEGKRLYVDYEAYMIGCEITQLPDLFDRVPESRKFFITADSARPRDDQPHAEERLSEDQRRCKGFRFGGGGHRLPAVLRHRCPSALHAHDRRASSLLVQDRPVDEQGAADPRGQEQPRHRRAALRLRGREEGHEAKARHRPSEAAGPASWRWRVDAMTTTYRIDPRIVESLQAQLKVAKDEVLRYAKGTGQRENAEEQVRVQEKQLARVMKGYMGVPQ
jgi:hypothetical protein